MYAQGDKVTIMRGKLKGLQGVILEVDEANETYAVKAQGNTLAIVNAVNVKVPEDATVSANDLKVVFADASEEFPTGEGRAALLNLAGHLVGFGVNIELPE